MTQETVRVAKEHGLLKGLPPAAPVESQDFGKVALLSAQGRGFLLCFVFPPSIRALVGGRGITLTKEGPSSWAFHISSEGKRHISRRGDLLYNKCDHLLPDDRSYFGRSKIEMVMVGDTILAHLNPKDRSPINEKFKGARRIKKGSTTVPTGTMETYTRQVVQNPLIEVPDLGILQPEKAEKPLTRDEMTQLAERALQAVKDLERLTLYRLAKVTLPDGTKVWRAVVDPVG